MAYAKRYAVIDEATGKIVNVVMWDGVAPWAPPVGTRAEQSDTASVEPVDGEPIVAGSMESRVAALEKALAKEVKL